MAKKIREKKKEVDFFLDLGAGLNRGRGSDTHKKMHAWRASKRDTVVSGAQKKWPEGNVMASRFVTDGKKNLMFAGEVHGHQFYMLIRADLSEEDKKHAQQDVMRMLNSGVAYQHSKKVIESYLERYD
jgi:hypothetical protein